MRGTIRLAAFGALALLPALALAADPKVAVKRYDTGGIYEGEFKDGKQHGRGKFTLPGGYEYEGEWVEGRIEGKGRVKYANGSIYEGALKEGAPSGHGKITYADGGSYEGEWFGGVI